MPKFEAPLGRAMYAQNYVLRGKLPDDAWREFLLDCVTAMGMSPAGDAAQWFYPTEDGKGGNGATICQPMTESFIVVDSWPDHDGAYLHVSSCKRFDPSSLIAPVRAAGMDIDFAGVFEALRL